MRVPVRLPVNSTRFAVISAVAAGHHVVGRTRTATMNARMKNETHHPASFWILDPTEERQSEAHAYYYYSTLDLTNEQRECSCVSELNRN